jgi:hypothetical protein
MKNDSEQPENITAGNHPSFHEERTAALCTSSLFTEAWVSTEWALLRRTSVVSTCMCHVP